MPVVTINGKATDLNVPDDMPLLWALRDVAGLTGTKFGCAIAMCGACTVHVDGQAVRSCATAVATVAGRQIVTIEAIGRDPVGRRVQAAWRQIAVAHCGYCQSGHIMAATALLKATPQPTEHDIDTVMSRHHCRCGTYGRIRSVIEIAAASHMAA